MRLLYYTEYFSPRSIASFSVQACKFAAERYEGAVVAAHDCLFGERESGK